MSYPPPPMYPPMAPPPKKSNTALIVSLAVGIPVLLILCCVGVFIGGPIVGLTLFKHEVDKAQQQVAPVAGSWTNEDGSIVLVVGQYATVTVDFSAPLKSGYCDGSITNPGSTTFPITFTDAPCGPVTGSSATLTLQGSDVTLSIPGLSDYTLHKA